MTNEKSAPSADSISLPAGPDERRALAKRLLDWGRGNGYPSWAADTLRALESAATDETD